MGMATVEVELPEEVVEHLGGLDAVRERVPQSAVLEWVRTGDIDPSCGAHLLGMPLASFAQLMSAHGISYYRYTPEEWAEQVTRVEDMLRELPGNPGQQA